MSSGYQFFKTPQQQSEILGADLFRTAAFLTADGHVRAIHEHFPWSKVLELVHIALSQGIFTLSVFSAAPEPPKGSIPNRARNS